MIVIFAISLFLGLGAFLFFLVKGMNEPDEQTTPSSIKSDHSVPPLPITSEAVLQHVVPSRELAELKVFKEAAEKKIIRLEEMLDEKNRVIVNLQKIADGGQDHQSQVETLKLILQDQIDELKQQNKKLKEDLQKSVNDCMDLQARVFTSDQRKSPSIQVSSAIPNSMYTDPDLNLPAQNDKSDGEQAASSSMSLRDVFSSGTQDQR